jgi:hypothetical protein
MKSEQLELTFGTVAVETFWISSPSNEANNFPTWAEIISTALKELGGEGRLKDIPTRPEESAHSKEHNLGFHDSARRATICPLRVRRPRSLPLTI